MNTCYECALGGYSCRHYYNAFAGYGQAQIRQQEKKMPKLSDYTTDALKAELRYRESLVTNDTHAGRRICTHLTYGTVVDRHTADIFAKHYPFVTETLWFISDKGTVYSSRPGDVTLL